MPRNKKLELENISPRKWKTVDGRFGVVKLLKPINPYLVTEVQKRKIEYVYSIRDLRSFDMPGTFYELAPELGKVDKFAGVFSWLGRYTGEGSFDTEDVERETPKTGKLREWRDVLLGFND